MIKVLNLLPIVDLCFSIGWYYSDEPIVSQVVLFDTIDIPTVRSFDPDPAPSALSAVGRCISRFNALESYFMECKPPHVSFGGGDGSEPHHIQSDTVATYLEGMGSQGGSLREVLISFEQPLSKSACAHIADYIRKSSALMALDINVLGTARNIPPAYTDQFLEALPAATNLRRLYCLLPMHGRKLAEALNNTEVEHLHIQFLAPDENDSNGDYDGYGRDLQQVGSDDEESDEAGGGSDADAENSTKDDSADEVSSSEASVDDDNSSLVSYSSDNSRSWGPRLSEEETDEQYIHLLDYLALPTLRKLNLMYDLPTAAIPSLHSIPE